MMIVEGQAVLNEAARKHRARLKLRLLLALGVWLALGAWLWLYPWAIFDAADYPSSMVTAALANSKLPAAGLIAGAAAMTVLCTVVYFAWCCALFPVFLLGSGRKDCVLYLRKFGLTASTRLMNDVIGKGLGRHYRVITLDDNNFKSMEVPSFEKVASRLVLPAAAMVAIGVFLAFVLLGLGIWLTNSISLNGLGMAGLVLALVAGMFLLPLVISLVAVLLNLLCAVLLHRLRIRRSAQIKVANAGQLSLACRHVEGLSGWYRRPSFMAAQATVVTSSNDMWQELVVALSQRVSAVIMDVSVPTSNLLWEVAQTSKPDGAPLVLVADPDLLEKQRRAAGTEADLAGNLRSALGDMTVLAYRPATPGATRLFRRMLLAALDNVCADNVGSNRLRAQQLRRPEIKRVTRYLGARLGRLLLTWMAVSIVYWTCVYLLYGI